MADVTSAPYRLEELGWLQFEQLCSELLAASGIDRENWHGDADRLRSARVTWRIDASWLPRPVRAPAIAFGAWIRSSSDRHRLQQALRQEAGRQPVVVLTNDDSVSFGFEEREVQVVGPRELGAALDASPAIRRRVPFVLGIRDLDGLVEPEVRRRSTADVEAAAALVRVFVPTRAYQRTLDVLDLHGFAVVTGPPEMGKTAIARTVALTALTDGWEAHECTAPEDLWRLYARDRRQVFVADDAFGSTEYRPDAAERWALELDRILRATDENHRLIWTSRPAPLRAGLRRIHREHRVERWPQPAEVQVAASALDLEEKALILFRHTQAAQVPPAAVELVRTHALEIVEHEHFTPERIRRFVARRLPELARTPEARADVRDAVRDELREPTAEMAASLHALSPEHRAVLVALVDSGPGPVPERELAAAVRRHADAGLPRAAPDLVDRLTDHFVRVVAPDSVVWVHPSWRDLVIDDLAREPEHRRRFLHRCSLEGLLLALSTAGGATGARQLPLLIDDADWDVFTDRMVAVARGLDDHALFRLLAALDEAAAVASDERLRRELLAAATTLLQIVRRIWDATGGTVSTALLAQWLDVAARLGDPLEPPNLLPTWIELLPTESIDLAHRDDLRRLDDWISLVDILRERLPQALRELGFPGGQVSALLGAIASAHALAARGADEETAARVTRTLRRLGRVVPQLVGETTRAAQALQAPDPSRVEWWEPRLEPIGAPAAPPPERAIVRRILDDLRPYGAV